MTEPGNRPRVLCVDDEFSVLKGLERVLNSQFDVTGVANGADALIAVQYSGPFAVVISDFRLIETDGVRLLARVAEIAPTTVRLLLTGHAAMDDAISAINDGHVFGYIQKPCKPELLLQRVADAVRQHQQQVAERALLEETLRGSIKALMDLLALTCPVASGRAMRLGRYAAVLADELKVDGWDVEMSAMLSQVGCVTIAPDLAERICRGGVLSEQEEEVATALPLVAERILAAIPRLERVREILRRVNEPWVADHGSANPPLGSSMLRLVSDFDRLDSRGIPASDVIDRLSARRIYPPAVVEGLSRMSWFLGAHAETVELPLSKVELGMVLASDVLNPLGILLIARGQDVTAGIYERIHSHWMPFAERLMVNVVSLPPANA